MTQLKLCKIPWKPSKEPEIPHRIIQAYVRDKLQGFSERQRERERRGAAGMPAKRTLFDLEDA